MRSRTFVLSLVVLVAILVPNAAAAKDLRRFHVDPAPLSDDLIRRVVPESVRHREPTIPDMLERRFDEALVLLERLETDDTASGETPAAFTGRMLVAGKTEEIRAAQADLRDEAGRIRARLITTAEGHRVAEWDAQAERINARLNRVIAVLEAARKSGDRAARAGGRRAARDLLKAWHADVKQRPHQAPSLPDERLEDIVPRWAPPDRRPAAPPVYITSNPALRRLHAAAGDLIASAPPTPAEASACTYSPADLGESQEVQLTPEIRDLAATLGHSPVRLFQWVANEVTFAPYYGSLKGTMATLWSRLGNATDQASLLIALLRASGIPARYVKGTIRFTDDERALRWIGAKTWTAAHAILAAGWIPATLPTATSLELTHIWVEACVPYTNYRGTALDQSGHRWVPLDPSFKEMVFQPGIAVNVAFDYDAYLLQRTSLLPHEKYAEQVEAAVKAMNPNWTLADVPYRGEIVPRALDILPASLPYEVASFTAWDTSGTSERAEVPDDHRYKLEMIPQKHTVPPLNPLYLDQLQQLLLHYPAVILSMPDIVHKRVTWSYKGATPADQALLDAWKTNPDSNAAVPCSPAINVLPVIRVEGVEQGWTTPEPPVVTQEMTLCPTSAPSYRNGMTARVTLAEGSTSITAGRPEQYHSLATFGGIDTVSYAAIIGNAGQSSDNLLRQRTAKLLASVQVAGTNLNESQDDTAGEFLHLVGLKYHRYRTDAHRMIAMLDGVAPRLGVELAMTQGRAKIAYILDEPFAIYQRGYLVDLYTRRRTVDLTTGQLVYKTARLDAYMGSAYEALIWEENARLNAINTIRGIWRAREVGLSIVKLNQANWNAESWRLQYPQYVKDWIHLYAYVSNYDVTVPTYFFTFDDWYGTVMIAETAGPPISVPLSLYPLYGGGVATGTPLTPNQIWQLVMGEGEDVADCVADCNVGPGQSAGNTTAGDPVNMVTGNMYHAERDISIKGRGGLPIVFERHYNSLKPQNGPFGFGWTHTFHQYLDFKDDNADAVVNAADTDGVTSAVVWADGTGAKKIIRVAGEGTTCGPGPGAVFERPRGSFFDVTRNSEAPPAQCDHGGTYTIREKNGLTYTFEAVEGVVGARARLIGIRDRNGNRLALTYAAGLLTAVTDDLGRSLTFMYDTNGRITQITDFTGRTHQYTYDTAGNLTAYRNPLAVSGVQNPVTYTYYAGGGLDHAMRSYTLPRGNGMTFEYYANGRAFRHYNTLGETTTFVYNEPRREATSTNERGFTRRYFFDELGNATKVVEETGGEWRYTYDANPATPHNRLTQQTPLGYETRYCYDTNGNVTREITPWAVTAGESCATATPGAGTVTYEYFNAFSQPQKIKDARGHYTIAKYDARGNVTERIGLRVGVGASIADPAGYTPAATDIAAWSIHTYDAYGNLLTSKSVRDPASLAGPTVTYTYDAQSLYPASVARAGDKDGDGVIGSGETDVATLIHDAAGRVIEGISGDWHATAFTYDAVDRIVTFRDPLGKTRTRAYDQNGNRVSETLPGVDTWTAGYDLSDRKAFVTNAAGFPMSYQYDPAGNVVVITNADGFTIRFEYDAGNRVVRALDEEGLSVSRALDLDGKPRRVTDPNGLTTSFEYWGPERHGRLYSKRAPPAVPGQPGLETRYDYDPAGNAIQIVVVRTDGAPVQETLTTFDEFNRPTRIVGPVYTNVATGQPERVVVCFAYNLLGFRTEVRAGGTTDPTGATPTCGSLGLQQIYAWDDFGRKLRETDALGRSWVTTYDVHGNPLTTTDPKGQTTTFGWGYGRQLLTRTAGGRNTRWTRNDLGQVTEVFLPDPTALYTYTYDPGHRLASVTDHRGPKTLTYDWSPGGLLNFFEDSDANRTDYSYDPHGRLAQIWAPNGDVVDFIYDAGGRLTEKWFPNGVRARYIWNGDGTLANLTNLHGVTTVTSHLYTYDGVGNRKTHMETVGGTTTPYRYTYDNLNRLIEARNDQTSALIESYAYDALGNRTLKTDASGAIMAYVYDTANQLLEARQGSPTGALLMAFAYDPNGNLTKRCEGGAVTASPTTCTGATVMDLTYDALNRLAQVAKAALPTQTYTYDDSGRRIQKTAGPTVTNYVYNGEDIHAMFGATWSTPTATYTHGPNTDDPIIQTSAGATRYLHADGLGTVVALTTPTGTIDATHRHDVWGASLEATGTPSIYGYTGREPDETGLVYYRARYYDPLTGRFTQRDPIGLRAGINVYAYADGNPVTRMDPAGTDAFPLHGIFTFFAGLKAGFGVGDSLKLAYFAMKYDFDPGSQDPSRANDHAMLQPGQSPSAGQRAIEDKIGADARNYAVTGSLERLAQGGHTVQDNLNSEHRGKEWHGFGPNWETVKHVLTDIFEPFTRIGKTIEKIAEYFRGAKRPGESPTSQEVFPDLPAEDAAQGQTQTMQAISPGS